MSGALYCETDLSLAELKARTSAHDLESLADDLDEDFPLEPTEEDFTDALEAGMANGTLVPSEADTDYEESDDSGKSSSIHTANCMLTDLLQSSCD